eukprot:365574-Chlamydomonas_euryale.AAC.22
MPNPIERALRRGGTAELHAEGSPNGRYTFWAHASRPPHSTPPSQPAPTAFFGATLPRTPPPTPTLLR